MKKDILSFYAWIGSGSSNILLEKNVILVILENIIT